MENSSGKTFAGFIFGAAVGVVAGLLFAPASGKETRKKIQKRTREYSDDVIEKLVEKVDDLKEYVKEVTEETKKRVKNIKPETKS